MQGKKQGSKATTGEDEEENEVPSMNNDAGLLEPVGEETESRGHDENDATANLEKELQKEREKADEYLRRLQYLQADFENYRKRVEREMSDVKRYGNDRLLADLLVVVDELELGLARASEYGESPSLVAGMGMVLKRFQNLLNKEGVARIDGTGSKFDPTKHEAALRVPSEKEEGIIVEEIRSGYTLRGRVLRPSIVKVSEGKGSRETLENVPNNTESMVEEEEEQ